MTIEELKQGIADLEANLKNEKNRLYIKYAISNNKVKKGDKVSDGINTIIVDKITYIRDIDGIPYCLYSGVFLTKKGNLNKRGEQICIPQHRVLTHETN